VAGPDEYIIKSGDTGAKIARERGVSLADLQTVNPGVNWTRLAVGQKIKLPKK
jgi:LysM repeat protein